MKDVLRRQMTCKDCRGQKRIIFELLKYSTTLAVKRHRKESTGAKSGIVCDGDKVFACKNSRPKPLIDIRGQIHANNYILDYIF